jgi:hypothetical protein
MRQDATLMESGPWNGENEFLSRKRSTDLLAGKALLASHLAHASLYLTIYAMPAP